LLPNERWRQFDWADGNKESNPAVLADRPRDAHRCAHVIEHDLRLRKLPRKLDDIRDLVRVAPRVEAQLATVQPLRRAGQPLDIAQAALWLASDESSFVTGASIVVDGGWTASARPPEELVERATK